MKVQRLRLHLTLDETAAEMSYRQLVAALEQACESAGLELSRSDGKRPVAQISLCAPLPQGVTSDCELADVFLTHRAKLDAVAAGLGGALPDGIGLAGVEEIGLNAPSLSATLRWSDYEIKVDAPDLTASDLQRSIDRLLCADALPSEYHRENRTRSYDLRPLIYDLRIEGEAEAGFVLAMRLCAEQERTARADQVLLALGLSPAQRIHRLGLHLEESDAALLAYRRLSWEDEP